MAGLRLASARAREASRIDATARAVIDCAADPIIALGADRAVLLWNPAAERMFGWSAAEVSGQLPPIIPEELRAEHNAVLERVGAAARCRSPPAAGARTAPCWSCGSTPAR